MYSFLRVLLIQPLLYCARRLAPLSPLPGRLIDRIYVRVHVIAADIDTLPDEISALVHPVLPPDSLVVAKIRLVTSPNSRARVNI